MRATLSRSLLPLLALLASATFAAETPDKVVREYMAALQTEGMVAASRYMHPDEMARFKEMLMPLIRRDLASEKREFTTAVFGSGATLESMEKVSGAELMTALMKLVGDKIKDIKFESVEILGSVSEAEIVHVVTRIGMSGPNGMKMRQMQVVSVKPHAGGWKLLLSGEIEGLAAALSAQ
jgi:hypothetical protein